MAVKSVPSPLVEYSMSSPTGKSVPSLVIRDRGQAVCVLIQRSGQGFVIQCLVQIIRIRLTIQIPEGVIHGLPHNSEGLDVSVHHSDYSHIPFPQQNS